MPLDLMICPMMATFRIFFLRLSLVYMVLFLDKSESMVRRLPSSETTLDSRCRMIATNCFLSGGCMYVSPLRSNCSTILSKHNDFFISLLNVIFTTILSDFSCNLVSKLRRMSRVSSSPTIITGLSFSMSNVTISIMAAKGDSVSIHILSLESYFCWNTKHFSKRVIF